MSTYGPSGPDGYRTVDVTFNTVTTDATGFAVDGDKRGLLLFSGLTTILAGATVSSATLTLSGWAYISTPGTDETFLIQAYRGDDLALPADWTAYGALPVLTSASVTTSSLNGQSTTGALNIKTIVDEMVANQGGDKILFSVSNPSYSGTGLDRITGSLTINYTGGGATAFPWHYYARQRNA